MKKAEVLITTLLITAITTLAVPVLNILPQIKPKISTIKVIKPALIKKNISIEKEWYGACVRTFSEIIKIKQWYVEPSMEYMFCGWLVAYNKLKG